MNEPSTELARLSLAEYERQLNPVYTDLQDRLRGELAPNGRALETMQLETMHADANMDIVKGLVDALPRTPVDFDKWGRPARQNPAMLAKDALAARLLQAHTVWMGSEASYQYNNAYRRPVPYYVIGAKPITPSEQHYPNLSLLLAPGYYDAAQSKGLSYFPAYVRTARVHDNEFEAAHHLQSNEMYVTYTKEQLATMYDEEYRQLKIDSRLAGSVSLDYKRYPAQPRKYRGKSEEVIRKKKDEAMRVNYAPDYTLNADGTPSRDERIIERIPNLAMVEYNVPHHLNRLATAFGKVVLLDSLLRGNTIDAIGPVDRLIYGPTKRWSFLKSLIRVEIN